MPYQLQSHLKGVRQGASPVYLHESDALAALGSSELLTVVSSAEDWAIGHAVFDRPSGLSRGMVVERWWPVRCGMLVNHLVREYLAGVR